MTSPSRRKRPTTRRNTNPRNLTSTPLAALGCWVALAGGFSSAAELQWRPARTATQVAAASTASVAAWEGADQSFSGSTSPSEASRSVVVRRDVERVAQAADPFDPFDAEMPSTDPVAAPPAAYDPFDDPAVESAQKLAQPRQIEPNSFPAPSLEEAFEEPTVERPMIDQPPAEEPEVEEETDSMEQLDRARQAIDRELERRESERGLADELIAPQSNPEIEATRPMIVEEDALSEELVVPEQPGDDDQPELIDELNQFQERDLPENDDAELQYGFEVEPLPPPTPEQLEARRRQIEEERLKSLAECEKLYDAVRADSIKSISLDIRQQGTPGEDFPFECEGRRPQFQPRNWTSVTYMWKASGLCHKPLYFEQVQLERYGHDWGPVLQPFVSGAHFFGTIPILPYKMGLQTPNECDYALGYYRPGSCAPYMIEPLGFTWRAAAFQAGAVTGAAFAIP